MICFCAATPAWNMCRCLPQRRHRRCPSANPLASEALFLLKWICSRPLRSGSLSMSDLISSGLMRCCRSSAASKCPQSCLVVFPKETKLHKLFDFASSKWLTFSNKFWSCFGRRSRKKQSTGYQFGGIASRKYCSHIGFSRIWYPQA